MNNYSRGLFWVFLFCSMEASAQPGIMAPQAPAFTVVPLGVKGGLDESNLSSYLVAAGGTDEYIALDAGTL